MAKLFNRAKMTISVGGSATVTLGSPVSPFQTFASSGVANSDIVPVLFEDGTDWELSTATYNSSTTQLSSRTLVQSTTGSLLNLSTNATASITPFASTIGNLTEPNTWTSAQTFNVPIGVTSGGTGTSTQFTAGSVVFAGASGVYTQDNAGLFWDDTNNRLGIGTTSPTDALTLNGAFTAYNTGTFYPQLVAWNQNAGTSGPYFIVQKSRAASGAGAATLVGDSLGSFLFRGFDTTGTVQNSAFIDAGAAAVGASSVDGFMRLMTIGATSYLTLNTNSTERMRIGSDGTIGINATNNTNTQLVFGGTMPSAGASSYGINITGTIPAASTSGAAGYITNLSTAAAAFTLPTLLHFSASQASIGAGSTVTNQYGFYAQGTLTGATNNYGFFSGIAAGTGRWNFYAGGTAANFFNGSVGIGVSPVTALDVVGNIYSRGAAAAGAILVLSSDATSGANGCTIESSFATGGYGPLIIKTNATERMRIDNAGRVQIGATSGAGIGVYLGGTAQSVSNQSYAFYTDQTIPSTSTSGANYFSTAISTAAAAFTCAGINHFTASQGTIGAGSTLSQQIGFHATSSLTGATNNFGFYGNIANGTGRYNFYANGTAPNFFGGQVGLGIHAQANVQLQMGGTAVSSSNTSYLAYFAPTIPSTSTTGGFSFISQPNTAAAAFTCATLMHFGAYQGTIGAGSSITSQYGFHVDAGLVGATNNYGFFANIPSGTGRWNVYSGGTAQNYFAGNVGIGTTTPRPKLEISGATPSYAITDTAATATNKTWDVFANGTVLSYRLIDDAYSTGGTYYAVTRSGNSTSRHVWYSGASVEAMRLDSAGLLGIGTPSPGTKLDVYTAASASTTIRTRNDTTTVYLDANNGYSYLNTFTNHPMLFGTNNVERMRIGSDGTIGINATNISTAQIVIGGNMPAAATSAYSYYTGQTVTSTVTAGATMFASSPSTAAASFTLGQLYHFLATQGTIGAGSTVANQYGFVANSTLTGATNNYGFWSGIPAATGDWNFYASGTADNRFAGNVIIEGVLLHDAPAPTTKAAAATLTAAEVKTSIIVASGSNYTLTLPTGTNLDASFVNPVTDTGFDFTIINTASGTITLAVNTGVTSVGTLTTTTGTSSNFRLRRTAANTYIVYRV